MNVETVRSTLLWCTVINYGLLLLWALLFLFAHDGLYRLHRRSRLSPQHFDAIQYGGIVLYKLGILLFNLVPYIALRIVS
jgi:hypothetical protein